VCGVAQAADSGADNGNGRSGTSQDGGSGLDGHLQHNGYGRYISDPEQFYYGPDDAPPSSGYSDSGDNSDPGRSDLTWEEGPNDVARGGRGGRAGTNTSHCEMGLGPGMKPKPCSGGTAPQDGADGGAFGVF
jgi:hypothetical protein